MSYTSMLIRATDTNSMFLDCRKFSGRKGQICEPCHLRKQHRLPFPNEKNRSWNQLDLIHSDVWGPTQNVNIGRCRYFVSFIDDFSRHSWIYLIEKTSEVFSCLRGLKNHVERETRRMIKSLKSGGGKKHSSGQFTSYLQTKGIQREFSSGYKSE